METETIEHIKTPLQLQNLLKMNWSESLKEMSILADLRTKLSECRIAIDRLEEERIELLNKMLEL